jgi:membrane associated rhomboid family serine protease
MYMPTQTSTFINHGTPVTYILMLIIFIFSSISLANRSFFMKMILHPYSIVKQHQWYRLLTADLVHNDIVHLILNEYMLCLGGGGLEETLNQKSVHGSWQFIFIYLFSYFSGIVYTTIRHRNDFNFSSAGASGSIMGVLFSFIILRPDFVAFYLPGVGAIKNIYGGLIYIALLIWQQKKRNDEITNHELHFFGALGGIAATFILFPQIL